jgi:hypothetical protein
VPIVLTTLGFVADSSTVFSILKDAIERLIAPDSPEDSVSEDFRYNTRAIRHLSQLWHSQLEVREHGLRNLYVLAKNDKNLAKFLASLIPTLKEMQSMDLFRREKAREEIKKIIRNVLHLHTEIEKQI